MMQSKTGMLRMDVSRLQEYLNPEYYKPKLSFWQKVGRVFGKAFSFLGKIGASVVAAAVPGIGIPIAAGLYGLSNVAGKLTANAEAKDAANWSAEYKRVSQNPVIIPGIFDLASTVPIESKFQTPQKYVPQASHTIFSREQAQFNSVESFKFFEWWGTVYRLPSTVYSLPFKLVSNDIYFRIAVMYW